MARTPRTDRSHERLSRPPLDDLPRLRSARLPTPLTPLIGREREAAAVKAKLTSGDVRLLALIGPGGVGKTRLALKVADDLQPTFADGVRFVPLASVRDPALVPPAIVRGLGLREQGHRVPADLLVNELRSKHLLLVLDNFEQILSATPLLGHLLVACPRLTILVTSRAVLHLYGEHDFPVPPLDLPGAARDIPLADVTAVEAVRLFVARAQAADPTFEVTPANAPAVVAICRALDGLPLAIELAAARVRLFPPTALLAELQRRLSLLTGGGGDVPPRMRTMRDAIAWSYDLLPAAERRLFRCLAVFAGGFTIPLATAVAERSGAVAGELFDAIVTLEEHSLLRRVRGEDDEPRFGMLETVREFGLEQLAAGDEDEVFRAAHAAYFLERAEEANSIFWGHRPGSWRVLLEPDLADLRAALQWFIDRGDGERALRLATALEPAWWILCLQTEGRRWLAQALDLREGAPDSVVAPALVVAGRVARAQGDQAESLAMGHMALAIAQHAGLPTADAAYLLTAFAPSDSTALASLEMTLVAYRAEEEPVRRAHSLDRIAGLILRGPAPDLDRARSNYEESLTLSRAAGHIAGAAAALCGLGEMERRVGNHSSAAARYREALMLYAELGHSWGVAMVFEALAALASDVGAAEMGATLLATASRLREELLLPIPAADRKDYDAVVARVCAVLGTERFDAGWIASRSRDVNEALADAEAWAAGVEQTSRAVARVDEVDAGGLSSRELEVLRLMADGLTDKQIADALYISRRTVTSHTASIFAKLDVPTRTAAASLAVRRGLV